MSRPPAGWSAVHASALVVGESGLLLRGPSGAGKSSLALALIARASGAATFAALVGDDRVFVRACGDRLLTCGVPGFEGLIERRFAGLARVACEARAVMRLVLDLPGDGENPPRMPEESERFAELCGVRLPRLVLDPAHGPLDRAEAALAALAGLAGPPPTPQVNFA